MGKFLWTAGIGMALTLSEAAPPGHSSWSLAFSDEFEGATLDQAKWSVAYAIAATGPGSWNDPANVRFEGGRLKLYGEKRPGQGKSFAGSAISTRGRFAHAYGYMEVSVKVPKGKGFSGKMTGVKPGGGVPPLLDILETRGGEPDHPYWYFHANGKVYGDGWNGAGLSAGFHVVGTEWTSDELILYVDGAVMLRTREPAPYLRMDICWALELMVGGSDWIGIPDNLTPWPGIMEIEYVRIYKRLGPVSLPKPLLASPAASSRRPGPAYLASGHLASDRGGPGQSWPGRAEPGPGTLLCSGAGCRLFRGR